MLALEFEASQAKIGYDEAVNLTSEKHDHCAQKVTYTKEENKNTLQKAPVSSRPNTLQRLS